MQFTQSLLAFVASSLVIATAFAAPATNLTALAPEDIRGRHCTTFCNQGTGGPNQNDCNNIASVLTGSQGSRSFTVSAQSSFTFQVGSCLTSLQNFEDFDVLYDTDDYGALANIIAASCNGAHGDNGGSCHFDDLNDLTFFKVQHS